MHHATLVRRLHHNSTWYHLRNSNWTPSGSSVPLLQTSQAMRGLLLAPATVAQLKRSRPNGFFTREDICKVVLAFLQADGRTGRKELADKITKALGLPEHHDKRVENAFEALERAGKISLATNSVSLIGA
jgi:hypothetical protein